MSNSDYTEYDSDTNNPRQGGSSKRTPERLKNEVPYTTNYYTVRIAGTWHGCQVIREPEDVPVPDGVRVAEGVRKPEYIWVPEGFRVPENIRVPGCFRVPERFRIPVIFGYSTEKNWNYPTRKNVLPAHPYQFNFNF